ncbi:hypothetical protein, partial [Staphylococcus aureus]|uniref:hypothetical protein n=1 Tax=Staphylococcus aureus TaxID=1280 RepID=UPI0038B3A26F
KPSIGLEYFGPLQQNIHTYIESALGVAAGSDEANAWTDVFGAFNDILKYSSVEKIGLSDSDRQALTSSWSTLIAEGKDA